MNFTEKLLLKELIPHLLNDIIIYDRNGYVIKNLRGFSLERLIKVFKTKRSFQYFLFLVQKQLDPLNAQLQIYKHENNYYITAVTLKKIGSSLTAIQAYALGVFLTMRKRMKKPILWSILEKELNNETIKIVNPRKQIESLVSQGLIYKINLNPLIFEYGPKLFLEFDKESLEYITQLIQEHSLLSNSNIDSE